MHTTWDEFLCVLLHMHSESTEDFLLSLTVLSTYKDRTSLSTETKKTVRVFSLNYFHLLLEVNGLVFLMKQC